MVMNYKPWLMICSEFSLPSAQNNWSAEFNYTSTKHILVDYTLPGGISLETQRDSNKLRKGVKVTYIFPKPSSQHFCILK